MYSIHAESNEVAKAGMVFSVNINCENMKLPSAKNEKSKNYSMGLSDTVRIQPSGQKAEVLTELAPKENVFYQLNDDEEEDE